MEGQPIPFCGANGDGDNFSGFIVWLTLLLSFFDWSIELPVVPRRAGEEVLKHWHDDKKTMAVRMPGRCRSNEVLRLWFASTNGSSKLLLRGQWNDMKKINAQRLDELKKTIYAWMNEWRKETRNEQLNEWRKEGMKEQMNRWMNEWMNDWLNEWINEWVNGWMDEWMNEWRNEGMKECMHACMHAWMDGWMKESMDE